MHQNLTVNQIPYPDGKAERFIRTIRHSRWERGEPRETSHLEPGDLRLWKGLSGARCPPYGSFF
jgi:hypothetical protein